MSSSASLRRRRPLLAQIDFHEGGLDGTNDAISTLSFAQEWTLQALGNWVEFREDADGNTSFTGAGDLDQDRTHNAANEITLITEGGSQTAWADPAQDAMGNITSYPKPSSPANSLTAKYDAWNRLAEVRDGANTVAKYEYDGLGRRIVKETYSGGSLAETRYFFYSNDWQNLEERVDGAVNVNRQYVWGVGYVDELILRDRSDQGSLDERFYALQDANFNVTALVDIAGDVWERYGLNGSEEGVRSLGFGEDRLARFATMNVF